MRFVALLGRSFLLRRAEEGVCDAFPEREFGAEDGTGVVLADAGAADVLGLSCGGWACEGEAQGLL